MQLYAEARTAGAGLRERRMWKMHLGQEMQLGFTSAALRWDKLVLLPWAILMSTLKDPSATTGGRVVTAYKERKLAARIKSGTSYSHWTWRLKSPISSAWFITAHKKVNTGKRETKTTHSPKWGLVGWRFSGSFFQFHLINDHTSIDLKPKSFRFLTGCVDVIYKILQWWNKV